MKRSVLKRALSVLIVAALLMQTLFTVAFDKDQQVYVSGIGHIDTAWQWPYATTISSYIPGTWKDMLSRYEANPDFVFNSSSPVHYKWAEEYYPDIMESIKTRVASGQWDIVGGQWIEPEGETVSGESQVRQFLYGQQYYNDTFGETADMGFLPDTPGHLWIMPQIFAKSGIKMWTGMRMNGFAGTEAYDGSRTYTGGSYSSTWWRNTNNTYGGDTFMWEGPDGTRILTVKPSNHYNNSLTASNTNTSIEVNVNELGLAKSLYYGGSGDAGGGVSQGHINNINNANASASSPAVKFAKISDFYNALTPDEIENITDTHLWKTELYYNHEHGLLLTHGEFKKYNNDTQIALDTAERLSSISTWLGASEYPQEKIDFAWEKMLTAQQHDVIAGCNSASNSTEVYNDWEIGLSHAGASMDNAMAAIASRADTTHSNSSLIPVLVFNSLGYMRTEAVEADVTFTADAENYVKVYDGESEIPAQIVGKNGKTAKIVFVAKDVPSVGYKVFHVESSSTPGTGSNVAASSTDGVTTIDSALFKVELDDINGNINQIYDKSNDGAKSFSQPMELQLLFDSPGNSNQTGLDLYPGERYFGFNTDEGWDEWIVKYGQMIREVGVGSETAGDDTWQDKNIGPDYRDSTVLNQGAVAGRTGNMSGSNVTRIPVNVTTSLIEQGPVRAVYKITKTFRDGTSYRPTSSSLTANSHTSAGITTIEQYVAVYHEIGRVDLSFHVDWRASRRMLKAAFYFDNPNEYATYDLTYGTIERPNMNKFRSMVAGHKWADMTGVDGSYGVSVISENKYSWDKPTPKYLDNSASLLTGDALEETLNPNYREDVLRLDLLRATKGSVSGVNTDMGHHYFDIGLYPHSGTWNDAGTPQESDSMTTSLVATQIEQQAGSLGSEFSFVSVSAEDVKVVALKKAQKSDDIIIRLYESVEKDNVSTKVTFAGPIAAVEEINLTELEDLGAVTVGEDGKSFETSMNHYELKTFRVTMVPEHSAYNDTKPVSNKIDLSKKYYMASATTDSNRAAGAFDINGNSYSAELWPATITSENIEFELGPKNGSNAVVSVGQDISLDGAAAGTHSVYFLAASVSGPKTGLFRVWYTDGTYEEKSVKVSNWNGYHNLWNEGDPAVEKNTDRLAYTFTHHHSLSSDRYYLYAYMYMYGIKTNPEKTVDRISLPNDQGIRVFAISTVTGGYVQLEDNTNDIPAPTEYTEIDDRHAAVKYIGNGWAQYGGAAIGSESSRQNTRTLNFNAETTGSAAVELTFSGTRIQFISEQGYNKGNFDVYINDELAGAADCFAGESSDEDNMACNFMAFDSGEMPKDTYKIRLVPRSNETVSNWYCIDAFLVWDYEEVVEYPQPPAPDPSIIDDADTIIAYTGEWTHLGREGDATEAPSAYAQTLSVTSTPGSKASIDFAGRGFSIFAQTNTSPAIVRVSLDGELVTTLIITSDTTQHFKNVFTTSSLQADKYTLELELIYGTFRFDAVMVDDNPGGTDQWVWVDNDERTTTNEAYKVQYSTGTGNWQHATSGRATSYMGTLSFVQNAGAWSEFRFRGEAIKIIVLGNSGHTNNTRVQIWDLDDELTGDGTEVFNQTGYTHRLPDGIAETGQQVAFIEEDLPLGNYRIRMTNNTSSNTWFTIDAFAYIPEKQSSSLVGYVYDAKNGMPIEGAKVEIVGEPTKYDITDSSGRYEFFAEPGSVSLKVTLAGYYDETLTDVVVVKDKYTFVDNISLTAAKLITGYSGFVSLVAGCAANINATVETDNPEGLEVFIGLFVDSKLAASAPAEEGKAIIKVSAAAMKEASSAYLAAWFKNGEPDMAGMKDIPVRKLPDNIWKAEILNVGDGKTTVLFGDEIELISSASVTINGVSVIGFFAKGVVLTIDAEAEEGDVIEMKGIKYPALFPSYSFTFKVTR